MATMHANVDHVKKLIIHLLPRLTGPCSAPAGSALRNAVFTDPHAMNPSTRKAGPSASGARPLMLKDFHQFFPLFSNVVMPVLAGLVFFAMAKYVKRIGPLRTLIAGNSRTRARTGDSFSLASTWRLGPFRSFFLTRGR